MFFVFIVDVCQSGDPHASPVLRTHLYAHSSIDLQTAPAGEHSSAYLIAQRIALYVLHACSARVEYFSVASTQIIGRAHSFQDSHPALADEHYLRTASERQRLAAARHAAGRDPVRRSSGPGFASARAHPGEAASPACAPSPRPALAEEVAVHRTGKAAELHPALVEAARSWTRALASAPGTPASCDAPGTRHARLRAAEHPAEPRRRARGREHASDAAWTAGKSAATSVGGSGGGRHGEGVCGEADWRVAGSGGTACETRGPACQTQGTAFEAGGNTCRTRWPQDQLGGAAVSLAVRIGELQAGVRALRVAHNPMCMSPTRSLADHLAAAGVPQRQPCSAPRPPGPRTPNPETLSSARSLADHLAGPSEHAAPSAPAASQGSRPWPSHGARGCAAPSGVARAAAVQTLRPAAARIASGCTAGRTSVGRGLCAATGDNDQQSAPECSTPAVKWLSALAPADALDRQQVPHAGW